MTRTLSSPPSIARDLSQVSIAAREEARFFTPSRRNLVSGRRRFIAILGLAFALHAGAIWWFLYRDAADPALAAPSAEVAVEVVQEPPPPPEPQQPEDKPEPKPTQMDEKPATSAPRAPSLAPVDTKALDPKTAAPKMGAAQDGRPEPAKEEAAAPPEAAQPDQKATKATLPEDPSDAEALDKAKPDAQTPLQDKDAAPKPVSKPAKTEAARQLSAPTTLPTYNFAAATKMSEFPAGDEDNRYLSVVFAKVMSRNRYTTSAAARRHARGMVRVAFVVDFMGRVSYQAVSESSGQADLDALAMAAVRSAAPFPPPPGSGSQQLMATMNFGQ